jgi:ATP-dependent protease ClpP protease subunit
VSDTIELPRYRYRGSVEPSAAVKRPVAVTKNAAASGAGKAGSSATLDIFDVIDSYGGWWGVSALEVDAALKQIGDVDTLYVRLNSPGGEATEGVAIANLLRAHAATVRATVYGLAASAASAIAISADVVSMAPGSLMMVHEAAGIEFGSADDMRAEAEALDAINESYAGLYALKAGGTAAEWLAVMHKTSWYTADGAVTAKLADAKGIDPQMPAGLPVVEDGEPDVVVEIDVEISPAARAAARRFDLSMLPNAPAALAPKTPAEPPETQDTHNEEAVTMTPDEIKALRERLGLAENADASAINAKLDELEEAATKPAEQAQPDDKPTDLAAAKAALEADGKVVVSQAKLDALTEQAQQGAQARAKQITDERNELIEAAMSAGKISRSDDTRKVWEGEFARNFDTAKADLDTLPARFPVGEMRGTTGHDGSAGDAAFTDDEAAALGALAGVSGKALQA